MKEIKWLAENISEELHDAEKYAKAAHKYKDEDSELARTCYALAEEELKHADKLHREAVRVIREHRESGETVPASMQAIWDWEHDKMVDHTARIRHMLDMYSER
jgi:predicted transcriptional regulator YdeE